MSNNSKASNVIPLIAVFVAAGSLALSGWIAWGTYFKPADYKGAFPRLIVWTLKDYKSDKPNAEIICRYLTPSFWIRNVGARDGLIEDIRLILKTTEGEELIAYPQNLVPVEAIESPYTFINYESLDTGGPFQGFSLTRHEEWKSSYSYTIQNSKENYHKLKGDVNIQVQAACGLEEGWLTVITEVFEFGEEPDHLKTMISFPGDTRGARMSPLRPKSWRQRRDQ